MKEDKRERIREAAIKVFSEKGFYEARADEIAQTAGVAVGTIYNYFKNKEAILLDIFATELAERKRFYEELRRGGLPALEQIHRILERHFTLIRRHRKLMQVLLQERFKPGSELRNELAQLYREIVAYVEELIREGIKEGWVRRCNPKIIAHALFGAVESAIGCGMIYSQHEAEEILRQAPQELAEFIWKGIGLEGG
jgi:TetR/AcrR family fatty acid metabolism transcriptional regulator